MAKKRVTPEEEYLRVLERLHRRYGSKIDTQQDLKIYLSDMVDLTRQDMTSKQKDFYKGVEDRYIKKYVLPSVLEKIKKEGRVERVAIQTYQQKDFNIVGKIKNKIVYSRKDILTRRKKMIFVYRDKKGRFSSVKKTSIKIT